MICHCCNAAGLSARSSMPSSCCERVMVVPYRKINGPRVYATQLEELWLLEVLLLVLHDDARFARLLPLLLRTTTATDSYALFCVFLLPSLLVRPRSGVMGCGWQAPSPSSSSSSSASSPIRFSFSPSLDYQHARSGRRYSDDERRENESWLHVFDCI